MFCGLWVVSCVVLLAMYAAYDFLFFIFFFANAVAIILRFYLQHSCIFTFPCNTGNFAVWGGTFSSFDCALQYLRNKDDHWNAIASGAATGGVLALRGGSFFVCLYKKEQRFKLILCAT